MYEERITQAVENFKKGFNCSQSVVAAFCDLYGLDENLALRAAASFGGGIGRMRQTCGAACGMFFLVGLETGSVDPKDREGKGANYAAVQDLAGKFKEINGSIICGELLGLKPKAPTPSEPEQRTEQYYKKRPCVKMVETAATLFAQFLEERHKND